MAEKKFYFDDPEGDALAPETSHPNFVKHMTAAFYYDCTDEFSPFGNDDGADLLLNLEEWYQEKKGKGKIVKWLFKTIDEFGFKYTSEGCSAILDEATLKQLQEEDPHFLTTMDNTIIAAAFGQYKISGQIDQELKEVALTALKRQVQLSGADPNEVSGEYLNRLNIMTSDLMKIE